MSQTATILLQITDRSTGQSLTPIEERVIERQPHESDFDLEYRVKREFLRETEDKIKYTPIMRKKLGGRDWGIDSVLL